MKKNLNVELNEKINIVLKKTTNNYDTLVLCGGGIRGIIHLGVLKYLEINDILKSITTFVGTSVGALIPALYLIGFTIDELYEFICSIDLTDYLNLNPISFLSEYGLDNGNGIYKILTEMLKNKKININITLLELYNLTKKTLVLTTTCINSCSLVYLSHITYPNLPLITAIKMATAIPFLFTPIKYDDKLYCDGGIIDNFPIKYCITFKNVLGVCFETTSKTTTDVTNIMDYSKNIIMCISSVPKIKYYDNTLYIPVNTSSLAFNLSRKEKQILFDTGFNFIKLKM